VLFIYNNLTRKYFMI